MRYQTDQYNRIVLQGLEYDRYQAFSDDEKASIRKHFRWNRKYKKWVSRDNNSATVQAIEKLGFKPESGKAELAPAPRRQSRKGSRKGKASAPDTGLTFAQHLAAWEALRGEYDSSKYESYKQGAYLDQFGAVVIKTVMVHHDHFVKKYNVSKKSVRHVRINRAGTSENYDPEWTKKTTKNLYEFENGVYGKQLRNDPEWFIPSDKDGYSKNYSNGKQVDAAAKKLLGLGFKVKTVKSFGRFSVFFSGKGKKFEEKPLKPIKIPSRIYVPPAKRKPAYDLSKSDGKKVRADIVKQEILLGKMEVATYRRFDGMTDSWDYYKESEYKWHVPDKMPHFSFHDTPTRAKGSIRWDNYYLRYRKGKIPAYVDLEKKRSEREKITAPKATNPSKIAVKFLKTAQSLFSYHDKAKEQLKGQARNTPKRNRQWNTKNVEADIAYDKATYYKALGLAWQVDQVPGILKNISPTQKDGHMGIFVPQGDGSGGYYSYVRADKPYYQTANPKYLERVAKSMGLTVDQLGDAHKELDELVETYTKEGKQDRKKENRLKQLIDEWRFSKQPGFFPTPEKVVEKMLYHAALNSDVGRILEPSAGLGHIADAIREKIKPMPGAKLEVVEKWASLREILELKGHKVVGDDFLKFNPKYTYDRILMNPPFEKGQDGQHIQHAFELLAPGGILVAIAGEGIFYRKDRKSQSFRDFVDANGKSIKLPEGAFKSAFRSTGVRTRLVVVRKQKVVPQINALGSKTKAPKGATTREDARKKKTGAEKLMDWVQQNHPRNMAGFVARNLIQSNNNETFKNVIKGHVDPELVLEVINKADQLGALKVSRDTAAIESIPKEKRAALKTKFGKSPSPFKVGDVVESIAHRRTGITLGVVEKIIKNPDLIVVSDSKGSPNKTTLSWRYWKISEKKSIPVPQVKQKMLDRQGVKTAQEKGLVEAIAKKEEKAKKKKTGKQFSPKQRKAAKEKIRSIVQQKAKGKESLTAKQVIAIGKMINAERSLYSQFIDLGADNKIRRLPTEHNLKVWAKNPGKSDLIGVDNFKKYDPTVNVKRPGQTAKIGKKEYALVSNPKGTTPKKAEKAAQAYEKAGLKTKVVKQPGNPKKERVFVEKPKEAKQEKVVAFGQVMPVAKIRTDESRFQNRRAAFSQASVNKIVRNFDPNKFDPVTVWKDPKNGWVYMLSGHSRLAAAKKLKLKEIPVRFFKGKESEAIVYARVDANRAGTAETLQEDIAAFTLQRDGDKKHNIPPMKKTDLRAKWGSKYNALEAYSHLNPKGKFLSLLGTPAEKNFPYIQNKAMWVGNLRRHFPRLTNAHEKEMFDYLFGKKGLAIKKEDFIELVNKSAGRLDFDPNKKLHLERGGVTGTNARADTRESQRRINEIEKELKELRSRMRLALTREEKDNLAVIAKRLREEKERLERGVKTMLKSQQTLF